MKLAEGDRQRWACGKLTTVLQLAEKPQNFKIQPDERYHQAKRRVPFHVFRRALFGALLDEVKIKNKIKRGNYHHEETEEDPEDAAAVNERDVHAEKT